AVDHEVPNPAVKASIAQLKRLRTTAQKLRAALGRALVLDMDQAATAERPSSKAGRPPHVAPTTRAALISQLQTLELQIEETRSQLRSLPARVPLSSSGPLPQVPRLERKLIADVVKIAAYNAQSWLPDRRARH